MRLGKADIREIGGLAVEVGSPRDPYQGILNSKRGETYALRPAHWIRALLADGTLFNSCFGY